MMQKAARDGQKGVALTDHGNMFGAFKFVNEAKKAGVKPILGCEFYMVDDRWKTSFAKSKGERDNRYHQLLLAKNKVGYQNLTKLCSLGFIDGMYGKFPRIDKELILQYHEGLIATSCCIGAEIPQTILRGENEKAEEMVKWWLDLFGEDFYIELQRHRGLDNVTIRNEHNQIIPSGKSQEDVNQVLLSFAKKYNIKTICTNDSHYVEEMPIRTMSYFVSTPAISRMISKATVKANVSLSQVPTFTLNLNRRWHSSFTMCPKPLIIRWKSGTRSTPWIWRVMSYCPSIPFRAISILRWSICAT
jgi:DNA polymerase III alpha subunit